MIQVWTHIHTATIGAFSLRPSSVVLDVLSLLSLKPHVTAVAAFTAVPILDKLGLSNATKHFKYGYVFSEHIA